jgi:hypothetical protein
MSLINDMLRSALEARRKDAAPAVVHGVLTVDCPAAPRFHSNLSLAALAVAVMLLSGFMMLEWFRSGGGELKARAHSYDSAINPVSGPPSGAQTIPPLAAPGETKPGLSDTNNAEQSAATEPAANVVAAEQSRPAPVTYKLQGLIYEPGRCSAVINGRTVFVGDRVEDARVVGIGRDSAIIVTAAGRTNVLDLF